MNRRKFLALAGGGVVLAAGGAFAHRIMRSPQTALMPWKQAGTLYTEPRKNALSFAILAPNPHNRQPWLVDLSTPNEVVLSVDTNKMLPHTDPFNRQITIGLGCFLEVMRMAAAENGYRVETQLFPEGEDAAALDGRPVAVSKFIQDANVRPDPLFQHVLARRSLKEPYDLAKKVPNDALTTIKEAVGNDALVGLSNDDASIKRLRQITREALIIEVETPRTFKESVDLFRIGHKEIEANPDGIDFTGPLFETMHVFGMMTRESTLDTTSTAFTEGMNAVLANADTAMGHMWIVTKTNSRNEQIATGRDWVRLNLACTAQGVATQPLSQALQEFPEMEDLYKQTHKLLAPQGGTVQMLARLGYGEAVAASPRWPLDTKITKG